jgi:hypothetical protein
MQARRTRCRARPRDGWFVEIIDNHGHRVDSVPIAIAPEEPWRPLA